MSTFFISLFDVIFNSLILVLVEAILGLLGLTATV
jgi:hypothetical protein